MSQSFSPYVTVYDTRQDPPVGELVYRASLPNYMRYPHYTTNRPANAVASSNLRKTQLPTAQREQNRQMNHPQTPGLETNEPITGVVRPEISSELVQPTPRRRCRKSNPNLQRRHRSLQRTPSPKPRPMTNQSVQPPDDAPKPMVRTAPTVPPPFPARPKAKPAPLPLNMRAFLLRMLATIFAVQAVSSPGLLSCVARAATPPGSARTWATKPPNCSALL